jgi:hypothetical protein
MQRKSMMTQNKKKSIQGLFLLVDRKCDDGLIRWINELDRRKMPALVMADGHTVNTKPDLIKRVAEKNFDVGCSYNDGAFWPETHEDMITWLPSWMNIDKPNFKTPYEIQSAIMHHLNDTLTPLLGKTMAAFSGKYFSYDENTLRIAEAMGIRYILARGTEKERAVFYQPEEFRPTIISVSNVPSKALGTGSLCDESLESRKETPRDFRNLLFSLDVDRVILVAQTHISGLMQEWWDVYQEFFDSGDVVWQGLDDFVVDPAVLPNRDIPMNKRADYMAIHLQEAKEIGEMV